MDSLHIFSHRFCILCILACLLLYTSVSDLPSTNSNSYTYSYFLKILPLSLAFCTGTMVLHHHQLTILRLPESCSLHPLQVLLHHTFSVFHITQERFYCHAHCRDELYNLISTHFYHRLFLLCMQRLLCALLYETSHFQGLSCFAFALGLLLYLNHKVHRNLRHHNRNRRLFISVHFLSVRACLH